MAKFIKKQQAPDELIYGIKPIKEAFIAGKEFEKFFVDKENTNPEVKELIQQARQANVIAHRVPSWKLNKLTKKNHQGVVAFLSMVTYHKLSELTVSLFEKGEDPFLIILDRVTDVRNLGAIARTAECAGMHGIVVPERESALIGNDAFKTSAGALSHLPVCKERNLQHAVKFLQNSGFKVIACTEKTSNSMYDVDFTGPLAIVMGSEEDGISEDALHQADAMASIPMTGKVESLNVSVAAGVMIYEAIRQRNG